MRRVVDVTPGLRRVTFTGEQLGAFALADGSEIAGLASTGFDDDVNLIFPYPGEPEPVLPTYRDGRWVRPAGARPLGRHYTVRRWDATTRELDVDFVRHGSGVAAGWAERARPGDRLHLGGPSASLGLPEGFDWLLVVGDDAAVPAVARLLEEVPPHTRGQVFLEVAEPSHQQQLRHLDGVTVTWLSRDGAGARTDALLGAVRSAPWWDGSVFAWVAAEQSVARDVRRHLVDERGMARSCVEFSGYWKRTDAVTADEAPTPPGAHQDDDPAGRFHRQSELLPPLAIRLAVELGIGDLVSRGVTTPAELAERTGTVEWALLKLLRYLEAIDLLASDDGRYRLTASGEELASDWMIEMFGPGGVTARLERGLFGLRDSLVTGRASYAAVTGGDAESLHDDPGFVGAYLDDKADGVDYLVSPLAAHAALADVAHLVVLGDVAGAVAAAVTQAHVGVRVTIVARPTHAAWLRDDLTESIPEPARRARVRVVDTSAEPHADAVLVVNRLAQHPDAEAVEQLRSASRLLLPGGRLLLFEETLDPTAVEDHDAEADLLHLTVHGSGYRTDAEVDALVVQAGLRLVASEDLVWGDRLRTLVPEDPSEH